jgi:hypothetical protein
MKKIILCLTILLFIVKSFSQAQTSLAFSKDSYLQKSKGQKTTGWIILGTGLGIAATGGIVQLMHEDKSDGGFDFDFTGAFIAIGGGVVSLLSIPFFISSSINKRKAASITISNQNIFLPQQNSCALKTQPTIILKIRL